MVLADLGNRLKGALSSVQSGDELEVQDLLKEISNALIESDVDFKLVVGLKNNIAAKIGEDSFTKDSVANKRKKLQKFVYDELVSLVDSYEEPPQIKKLSGAAKPTNKKKKVVKRESHVIMFVGLQGAGKTTSCTKMAVWYKKRGYKVGLVCADTFRAGAFDQLKQNALKANIAFYGSYLEDNPVTVSRDGVQKFKKENYDLIIVDTSGRHRQEASLFGEMEEIAEAISPNQTIMVMDGAIGKAAASQAQAFKESAKIGSIILTKMDGHAKGGGAISAIAATKTPIIFIGTGEHVTDFEPFRPLSFILKLLGIGNLNALMDQVKSLNLQDDENHKKTMANIQQGKFTLRDFQTQMGNFMKMGSLSNIASMIPGMSSMMGGINEEDASAKLKDMIYIMDSMTTQELDSDGRIFIDQPERIVRVARGAGCAVVDVEMVLQQQQMMSTMAKTSQSMQAGGGGAGANNMQRLAQQAQLNPGFMQNIQQMMGGMGGAGGANPMAGLMNNPQMMQQAQQMMRDPGMMQRAQQMMQDPGMMQRMMSQFMPQ